MQGAECLSTTMTVMITNSKLMIISDELTGQAQPSRCSQGLMKTSSITIGLNLRGLKKRSSDWRTMASLLITNLHSSLHRSEFSSSTRFRAPMHALKCYVRSSASCNKAQRQQAMRGSLRLSPISSISSTPRGKRGYNRISSKAS